MCSNLYNNEFSIEMYGKIMGKTFNLELAKKFAHFLGKNAIIVRNGIVIN